MSEKTNIQWCDSTINFWSGCTKASDGCKNCYAEERDKRHLQEPVSHWGKGAPRLKSKSAVKQALTMNRKPWICDECGEALAHRTVSLKNSDCLHLKSFHRRKIFSLSLGDWLDDEVPIEWLAEMLDTIRQCSDVTWILCTKRPENFKARMTEVMKFYENRPPTKSTDETWKWVLDWVCSAHEATPTVPVNIILLASVENQEQADKRIPELLKIPAACRGLSLEPLLGPVDLSNFVTDFYVRTSQPDGEPEQVQCPPTMDGISWLIIGGESGANARICEIGWIRSLVAQGKAAGVATFVKQLGQEIIAPVTTSFGIEPQFRSDDKLPAANLMFKLRDKNGGDISEWPEDLRIQEWPNGF